MVRHRQAEAECASSGFSAVLALALIGWIAFGAYHVLSNYEHPGRVAGTADNKFGQTAGGGTQAAATD